MLAPNVTWGQLREDFIKDVEEGVVSSENPLHDPKLRELSSGKANEDYVWPEEAARFNELFDDGEKTVTAAGTPAEEVVDEEEEPEMEFPSPLYFTVDSSGAVLELVKADDEGLFIRIESKWVDISDEEDFPTVYEQEIHFANDKSVGIWDTELEDKTDLKLKDIKEYLIK